jgi:hypothetical protein
VVKHQPVEHHVERAWREAQIARPPGEAVVEGAVGDQGARLGVLDLDARHQPLRRGEHVPAGVPATAHGEHVAFLTPEPSPEQLDLALAHVVVVQLQRVARRQAIEQVVGVVGLAHRAGR